MFSKHQIKDLNSKSPLNGTYFIYECFLSSTWAANAVKSWDVREKIKKDNVIVLSSFVYKADDNIYLEEDVEVYITDQKINARNVSGANIPTTSKFFFHLLVV